MGQDLIYVFIASIESIAKKVMEDVLSEDIRRDVRAGQIQRDLQIEQAQDQYKEKVLTMKDYLDKIAHIYKPKKV